MSKPNTVQHTLVGKHFRLSPDDEQVISELIVRPGKVTSGRKKTSSGVWTYFGHLCRVECGTTPSTDQAGEADDLGVSAKLLKSTSVTVIDDQLYYCTLCLQKVQSDKSTNLSDIKTYSLTSSTDSLRNHLFTVHSITHSVSNFLNLRYCARSKLLQ